MCFYKYVIIPACGRLLFNRVYLAAGTVCLHVPGFYEY